MKSMLAELNARRQANGQKPLKSWKGSNAKLQAAIDALPATDAKFSCAKTLKAIGVNPKVGRALIRKHNVARDDASIREFFEARR